MNIFVGNLSFEAQEADVRALFEPYGNIASIVILMRKDAKRSRGFCFLEMPDDQQGQAAITALSGKEFMGRPLIVELARHKKQEQVEKIDRISPVFKKPGTYKSGRRTHSFMKRHGLTKIPGKPQHNNNPMRWRKIKPWQKTTGQHKTWKKTEQESQPWKKTKEPKTWVGHGRSSSRSKTSGRPATKRKY